MAGVLASETSVHRAPSAPSPSSAQPAMAGPEMRESRPTATRTCAFPVRCINQRANAAAMGTTASRVRFTGWPPFVSTATPRMSLPFCSAESSIISQPFFFPRRHCAGYDTVAFIIPAVRACGNRQIKAAGENLAALRCENNDGICIFLFPSRGHYVTIKGGRRLCFTCCGKTEQKQAGRGRRALKTERKR